MNDKLLFKDLTEKIIKAFFNVHIELGAGFLESVYEKALLIELKEMKLNFQSQKSITVYYKNHQIGDFIPDIIVENKVIIEIKAMKSLVKQHEAQLINYLKATGVKIGLLVNFGEKVEFKRMIY